jgi:Fic family protein
MSDEPTRRHSVAEEPSLIKGDKERAEAEARNGLRQFDAGMAAVQDALDRGGQFKLRPSLILALHREALIGISSSAGSFRPAGVAISGSRHEPVGAHQVPELIEELCDYVNDRWDVASPIHLAAYVMWRLNWIHPFSDGNGRTSRVISYIVLSVASKIILPGSPTIPDHIVSNRRPYFDALEDADLIFSFEQKIDVGKMEDLLESLLAKQLMSVIKKARGQPDV